MVIEFVSKNYKPEEKLKNIIAKKLERLDKFFEPDTKIKVMLKIASPDVYSLELTIIADSVVMRAEVSSKDMFSNIDTALPKLEKQIIKHHTKIMSKSKKFRQKTADETETAVNTTANNVVKSKTYLLTPMTVEDAIEEQELVGHSFYVFLNKKTNAVNILYKRNDGEYGLIETEV